MHQSMRDDAARAIEQDMALYARAWQEGREYGRTEVSCFHTHPAIADSVARMFAGWDGAHAAHMRSVTRFRAETQRKDIAA